MIETWQQIAEQSRRRIGPSIATAPDKYQAKDTQERQKFAQNAPPGVEYQRDGAKAIAIIADRLYRLFEASLQDKADDNDIPVIKPDPAHLLQATQSVLAYFQSGQITPPELADMVEPLWVPANKLERWLQKPNLLSAWSQIKAAPAFIPQSRFIPYTDFPFIVTFDSAQQNYRLEMRNVYWCKQGLNSVYADNIYKHRTRWDPTRLQLTLEAPYLLLCNGVIRGSAWYEAVHRLIGGKTSSRPVVVILADGIELDSAWDKRDDFNFIVLPAPGDALRDPDADQQKHLPLRPHLAAMAQTFNCPVIHWWASPDNETYDLDLTEEWEKYGQFLGRCQLIQIDRQRTVLLPLKEAQQETNSVSSYWYKRSIQVEEYVPAPNWQSGILQTLVLPANQDEAERPVELSQVDRQNLRRLEAEVMMWSRIEAEAGLVAGAEAALYWAAAQIEAANIQGADWLAEALREPVHQILRNAGVNPATPTGKAVTESLTRANGPWNTFFVTDDADLIGQARERQFEVIEIDTPANNQPSAIVLGEAIKLGLVTPIPQVNRVIRKASYMALQLIRELIIQNDKAESEASS